MKKIIYLLIGFIIHMIGYGLVHAMELDSISAKQCTKGSVWSNEIIPYEIQHIIALNMIADFFLTKKTIKAHTDLVLCMAITGNMLITGSADATAKIWHMKTGKLIHMLQHTVAVVSLEVERWYNDTRDDVVITRSNHCAMLAWYIPVGKVIKRGIYNSKIIDLRRVYCGEKAAQASRDTGCIEIKNTEKVRTFKGHSNYITAMAISNDKLISASADKTIKVWNVDTDKLLYVLNEPYKVYAITIHNDTFITGLGNRRAKIYNVNSGRLLRTLPKHKTAIYSVVKNDDIAVTGSYDGSITLWPLYVNFNSKNFTDPNHAFFWIKHNILPMQAHLIARAHKAKHKKTSFKIDIASNDALIWTTFPKHVRTYLLKRLNIQLTNKKESA